MLGLILKSRILLEIEQEQDLKKFGDDLNGCEPEVTLCGS